MRTRLLQMRLLQTGFAGSCSRACLAAVAALVLLIAGAAQPLRAQVNFDRPGGDYLRSSIASGDPEDCAMQCERDRRCRAWSFNYPSEATSGAVCWLKSSVPQRVENNCCVSGIRGAGVVEPRTGAVEISTDRVGGDYRNFELKVADNNEVCKQACEADDKCRAWTYSRPGYAGKSPRCFLKSQIKPPRRKPGLTSGVVR